MKNLLLIFSVLLSASLSAVEYGHFRTPSSTQDSYIVLGDGDLFTSLGSGETSNRPSVTLCVYDINMDVQVFSENAESTGVYNYNYPHLLAKYHAADRPMVVGPAIVAMEHYSGWETIFASYSIIKSNENQNSNQASAASIPLNAVVIPSDSSGPVQIILESSEDMVNWNSANPGTYGASTNERFFRVRAVENTE